MKTMESIPQAAPACDTCLDLQYWGKSNLSTEAQERLSDHDDSTKTVRANFTPVDIQRSAPGCELCAILLEGLVHALGLQGMTTCYMIELTISQPSTIRLDIYEASFKQTAIEFYTTQEVSQTLKPLMPFPRGYHVRPTMNTKVAAHKAGQWLRQCTQSHEACSVRGKPYLPKRVVRLASYNMNPVLYVAIKVNANNYASRESAKKELRITEHITEANLQHPGRNFVATLFDSFRVASPGGTHICMVFHTLCETLWMLQHRFEGNTIPRDVLKPVSKLILEGLRYLHTECHAIHRDLKSDNILLALRNPFILDSVAQDEMNNPSPRKQADDRDIYLSRNYWRLSPDGLGRSVITDFGLTVRGDGPPNSHSIQPEGYRAPEVRLGSDWSYSVDIWNLGVRVKTSLS